MDQYEAEILFEHTRRLRGQPVRRRPTIDEYGREGNGYADSKSSYGYGPTPTVNIYNDRYADYDPGLDSRTRGRAARSPSPPPPPASEGDIRYGNPSVSYARRPSLYRRGSDMGRERSYGDDIRRQRMERDRSDYRVDDESRVKAEKAKYLQVHEESEKLRRSRGSDRPAEIIISRDRPDYAFYRKRDPGSRSRLSRLGILEVPDTATLEKHRPGSALSTSTNSRYRSGNARSRLRSRAEAYDRSHETHGPGEEKEEPDSLSDLFESEMSDESGDERAAKNTSASNGKQRNNASGASSLFGLESTVRLHLTPEVLAHADELADRLAVVY